MERFKNILVVSDDVVGDDDTLVQATALAKRNNAHLTVVEVIKDLTLPSSFITEREKHLHRLTATIQQEGIPLNTIVLRGRPFLEVTRQVLRENHDLVMVTAESEMGLKSLFFGETSLHLLRKCPCAVWVTKPGAKNDYKRIMAAVELNLDDGKENELDAKIMHLATSLAQLKNSALHVAHAWEVTGSDNDTLRSETDEEIYNHIYHKHELAHRDPLERFLEPYNLKGLNHQVHVMRGAPRMILPELADTLGIDLIVMGTISHSAIPGFLIGSTAESLLWQVNCAVLTVKPEGFVTTVTLD